MFATSSRIQQNAFCCTQEIATLVNTLLYLQEQPEPLKMASALPAEILCKIVDRLSLEDKFKTLSISTKWNDASTMLLQLQISITNKMDGEVYQVCDEETHRIDSKGWLPVSVLKNETALDAVLKKMPKLKAAAWQRRFTYKDVDRDMDIHLSYKFIQSVMKNGIEIQCLTGFSDIIHLSSLKHFFGEVDNDSLNHLVKLNKDLEVLRVSDTAMLLRGNFIGDIIHLEKLHTLYMTFWRGSNVSEGDFLHFLSQWKELNRRHLNIVLKQNNNIETDTVRAKLATTSNVNLTFIDTSGVAICFLNLRSDSLPLRKEARDRLQSRKCSIQ